LLTDLRVRTIMRVQLIAGGPNWKPVQFRRGPATVRGPRHVSERRLKTPLGVIPWEGEIDGLEPGDLAHLAPM
jgi:hypothetical protein